MTETVKLALVLSAAFRGSDAFDKAGGGLKGLQSALAKVRAEIAMLATYAAFNFLKESFSTFMQFEQRMAEIKSITGLTGQQISDLGDQIKAMTRTLPQTADELGAGLYEIFSAGITESADAMATLRLSAQAAVAGLTDTATTSKAGISTMNAFRLQVKDLTHIYDVQFMTVKDGILRYEELADVIGNVAPSAEAAGQSMEEMFATIAFLTRQGLSAANSATALGRAYDTLVQPQTIAKFRELGIAVADVSSEVVQTDPLLMGLRNSIASASSALESARQSTISAESSYQEQRTTLEGLEAQYNETRMAMEGFDDAMSDISLEQRKNRLEIMKIQQAADDQGRELTDAETARITEIEESNDRLSISYEELGIQQTVMSKTFEEQSTAVSDTKTQLAQAASEVETMTTSEEAAKKALDEANAAYDTQLSMTGEFRPLIDILGDLGTQMDGLSEVAKAQIIAELFPNIRARKAIMGIIGDTSLLTTFIDKYSDSSESAGAMQGAFADNLNTTAMDVKLMNNSVQELQLSIAEDLLPVFKEFIAVITPAIQFLSQNTEIIWLLVAAFIAYKFVMIAATIANTVFGVSLMATPIGWIVIAIAALIIVIVALILYWDEISAALKRVGEAVWNFIKPAVDFIVSGFQAVATFLAGFIAYWEETFNRMFEVFWAVFGEPLTKAWEGIKWFIDLIMKGITLYIQIYIAIWTAVFEGLVNFWNTYLKPGLTALSDFFKGIFEGIKKIVDWFKTAWETSWNMALSIVKPIINSLMPILKPLDDFLQTIISTLEYIFIHSVWTDAWNTALSVVNSVLGPILAVFQSIIDALAGLGDAMGDMLGDALQWGKDLVGKMGEGITDAVGGLGDALGDAGDAIKDVFSFDQSANDAMVYGWGLDLGSIFGEGLSASMPSLVTATANVGATLESGMVNADVMGVAGAVGGGGSNTDSHDTYNITMPVDKIEEGMDMGKFVSKFASEVSRQKKVQSSAGG